MKLSTEYLLTLLKTPKIGQVSVKYINDNISFKLSSIGELLDAMSDLKSRNPKLSIPKLEDLQLANDNAIRVLENSDKLGIKSVNYNEANYPLKLKRLTDFPIILYLKGSLDSILNNNAVAIIGTREPSDFGIRAGRKISGIFAENNFTIVSGLAIGCDTAGHVGAVDKNLPTVAVLASGVDIIYPKENKLLSERIIETGGSLLSEYEPGTKTFPQQFVQRDRIQSGLSDGLIVIETGIKGGTMHAVSAAKKMNMPIACLTGHPSHMSGFEKIKGNAYLIDSGASALGSPDQINAFILKLNPDLRLSDLLKSEPKLGIDVSVENMQPLTDRISNESFEVSSNLTTISDSEENDDLESVEVYFENTEQKFAEQAPNYSEIKELILKLTEEQKETNKLLKVLISQSTKEKSSKKKADNQSSFL